MIAVGAVMLASNPLSAGAPLAGNQAEVVDGTPRIGKTGIHCVRMPCPWRGITQIGRDGQSNGPPLWIGEDLPVIQADPDTQRRVAASWRDFGCLMVQGRFREGTLIVEQIVGDC